jgi:hypothetical protein
MYDGKHVDFTTHGHIWIRGLKRKMKKKRKKKRAHVQLVHANQSPNFCVSVYNVFASIYVDIFILTLLLYAFELAFIIKHYYKKLLDDKWNDGARMLTLIIMPNHNDLLHILISSLITST